MLIDMDLRNRIADVGALNPTMVVTGGDYEVRCAYVPIRCGGETVSTVVSLRFSYEALSKAGALNVNASTVPAALRAMLADRIARLPEQPYLPEPVDIGGLVLPAGLMLSSAEVAGRGAAFTVGPVNRDDVAAFIERQLAEREASKAAIKAVDAWAASG